MASVYFGSAELGLSEAGVRLWCRALSSDPGKRAGSGKPISVQILGDLAKPATCFEVWGGCCEPPGFPMAFGMSA